MVDEFGCFFPIELPGFRSGGFLVEFWSGRDFGSRLNFGPLWFVTYYNRFCRILRSPDFVHLCLTLGITSDDGAAHPRGVDAGGFFPSRIVEFWTDSPNPGLQCFS